MNETEQVPLEGVEVTTSASAVIQLIPYGTIKANDEEFIFDEESMRLIMEKDANRVNNYVIDYEHQSMSTVIAPAAGWITELIDKGKEGLWGRVEWNDQAKEYIDKKEYCHLSPVVKIDEASKRVIEFINAAVTNNPAIDGMAPLTNKSIAEIGTLLGLKRNVSIGTIKRTLKTMKVSHERVGKLSAELATLKRSMYEGEVKEMVEKAIAEGKLSPAQREWATSYAYRDKGGFTLFLKSAPMVVPFSRVISNFEVDSTPFQTENEKKIEYLLGMNKRKKK